jgi:ribosome-binding protein aMBF1 (putative translation factor)
MTMEEGTPRRVSLAEARAARIHRPEVAAAYEQTRLRYELAEAIRARREELGWSQRQLAERAVCEVMRLTMLAGAHQLRLRPGQERKRK